MATYTRESVEKCKETAFDIQGFLWEGRPNKSPMKDHTKEEYEAFLKQLCKGLWEAYDNASEELGWNR